MGDSIESICSFSAPFLFASTVNHHCRYINDFKTRRDTIKRYYARVLSHASFTGLEDFVWTQQSCYPPDFPQLPQDTRGQHVTAVCASLHACSFPQCRDTLDVCLQKYPSVGIKRLRGLLWIMPKVKPLSSLWFHLRIVNKHLCPFHTNINADLFS